MRTMLSLSRAFSTTKQHSSLVSIVPKSALSLENTTFTFTEDLCGKILDQYPEYKTLRKLHLKIITNHSLSSNPSLAIKLMRAYAACGESCITRHLFDEIPKRNRSVFFYNIMIRCYMNNSWYYDCFDVYINMVRDGYNPDHHTYTCILKTCSGLVNLSVGGQVHASVVKVGHCLNLSVGNGLVAMYGKCGCLVEARRVLDEMSHRDIVSWNSMVAGYTRNGWLDDALGVCKEMELLMIKPDEYTMASLLPAVTNTSLDNVICVEKMFANLGKKTLISWNVMIAIYAHNSMSAKAVDLFLQMGAQGIDPDSITIATVLPACGDVSALSLGRRIHKYVERKKMSQNLLVENALIDMYAKCGCLLDARNVFDSLKSPNIISWTSMISAYGVSGLGHKAVALFSQMQSSGLTTDSIAFTSVLSACSHSGLLDEGQHLFNLMITEYGIEPQIEHFACMVDLLGRAGKVDDAYSFIEKMPTNPSEDIWATLLGSCQVHFNMDIGLKAANRLYQLAPKQAGYYVLLYNMYTKAGKWQEAAAVKSIMKNKGIKTTPGVSNFQLNCMFTWGE